MDNVNSRSSLRTFKIMIAYSIKLMLFAVSIASLWMINDQTIYYLNNVVGNDILLRIMIGLADVMLSIVLIVLSIASLMLRVNKNAID